MSGDTSELVFTRKTTLLDGASILKVEETKKGIRVVNTGKNFKLPGQPASMRGRNQ